MCARACCKAFTITAREGSVLNPRFPAPVNTYNPTVHALVDAVYDALSNIVPDKVRADGSGSRSIILGGARHLYRQGLRAIRDHRRRRRRPRQPDGASGITVNQSNAMIAPVEIIESEFPTRLLRFELIQDSGGAGRFRGGLGIRREYLNLEDARFSIRSMKHVIPPNGCAGGGTGRPGDIWINPGTARGQAAADPLCGLSAARRATSSGSIRRAAAATAIRSRASRERVLDDVREGNVSPEAAERDYGVVIGAGRRGIGRIDAAATAARRKQMRTRANAQ